MKKKKEWLVFYANLYDMRIEQNVVKSLYKTKLHLGGQLNSSFCCQLCKEFKQ